MLVIDQLEKGYPPCQLFQHFSAQLPSGRYWLQGPNGVGKSTLLRLIAQLEQRSQGRVCWQGNELTPEFARHIVGISADAIEFPPFLTFAAILRYWQQSYPDADTAPFVAGFSLHNALSQTWQHGSVGQRKKLSLVLALSRPVSILLLDEPYNGLDAPACQFLSNAVAAHGAALCIVVSHQQHMSFAHYQSVHLSGSSLLISAAAGDE